MKKILRFVAFAGTILTATVVIPTAADATNQHEHDFTVIAQNDEGTITPSNFFSNLEQNAQASLDAPIYLDGGEVGIAETILTVTRSVGSGDPTIIIECSVELPDGNVFFNGSVHLAEAGEGVEVPVVGGTGKYEGARGIVTMTVQDPQAVLAFDFTTK